MNEVKRGRGRPPKSRDVNPQITDAVTLNVYKAHPDVAIPKFATEDAACFDLAFWAKGKTEYEGFNADNAPIKRPMHNGNRIFLSPGDRIKVPTGLIFDIPKGFSVRVHSRSGLALKQGLVLVNAEGVIDSDYVQETFVLIINTGNNSAWINEGDRIAQAELVRDYDYEIVEIDAAPDRKTDRDGGMGSTGIITISPISPQ